MWTLAGVGKELLFLMAMPHQLASWLGVRSGVALAALAFGAVHFHSQTQLIAASALGLSLSIGRALSQSTKPVLVWHAAYDVSKSSTSWLCDAATWPNEPNFSARATLWCGTLYAQSRLS
jgi:membrane protease YdiL (CAAX protease family)